jgi:hypothetical protein
MDEGAGRTLRAKYLDWCSARIAERFLALGPEEIYEMARPAESAEAGPLSSAEDTYGVLVQRVTESLLERISLPSYPEWRRSYAADPGRYDAEMLGFWKDASGGGPAAS